METECRTQTLLSLVKEAYELLQVYTLHVSFRLQNDVLILIVGKKPLLVGTAFEGKKLLIMIKVVLFHLSTPIFFTKLMAKIK